MANERFNDVFDALEEDPVRRDNLKLFSDLMSSNKIKTDKDDRNFSGILCIIKNDPF